MTNSRPVFIADTCIGGLSVVKSLWNSGHAVFMADYKVNPLGMKSDTTIAGVVKRWINLAEDQLQTLFPKVRFLDPGMYCSGLLKEDEGIQKRKLSVRVTGEVVSLAGVTEFAKYYLGNGSIVSC